MEIKYDRSGQPLPLDQQDFAQPKVEASIANPTLTGAQVGTKEFVVRETADEHGGEISDHQHENPFVNEYLKEQAVLKRPTEQTVPAEEPDAPIIEEEVELEEAPIKKDDHPNFKALRLSAERAERERDKAERERDQLLQRLLEQGQGVSKASTTTSLEDFDLAEDGYVEPKHIKQTRNEVKELRREMAEYKQKTARELQEQHLYRQFPDIDTVVSDDNIAQLKQLKPTYARQVDAIYKSGDIYTAGELAYNFMVDLGIYKAQGSAPVKDYSADKERAQKNAMKPRPLVSGAAKQDSPLSKANSFAKGELNDGDMKRYYMEMEAAIRNRGD